MSATNTWAPWQHWVMAGLFLMLVLFYLFLCILFGVGGLAEWDQCPLLKHFHTKIPQIFPSENKEAKQDYHRLQWLFYLLNGASHSTTGLHLDAWTALKATRFQFTLMGNPALENKTTLLQRVVMVWHYITYVSFPLSLVANFLWLRSTIKFA